MKKNNKKKEVIDPKNLPARLPIAWTIVYVLLLDKFNAPEWLWGAVGLFILFLWIAAIVIMIQQERVDIFEDEEEEQETVNSK